MSVDSQKLQVQILAGEDLSNSQYHVIAIDGTIADNSSTAVGILQNKPKNGEDCSLAFSGILKGKCGAAIVAGARIKVVTSGWLLTSSASGVPVGMALAASNSGGLVEFVAGFANAATSVNSI